jgi:protein-tyrosine phosphatase
VGLSVLVVCSANICRSPMAEHLLRARSGLDVASAGTAALVGRPIDSASAHALRELGIDAGDHVARQLGPALVDAADLVLTATLRHRAEVIADSPTATSKTFTIREFARLAASTRLTRPALIAALHSRREPPRPALDDIGDPFAAPYTQMRACAAQLSAAVDDIVKALDR